MKPCRQKLMADLKNMARFREIVGDVRSDLGWIQDTKWLRRRERRLARYARRLQTGKPLWKESK